MTGEGGYEMTRRKAGQAYVNFIEEVAAGLVRYYGINVFENEEAGRHPAGLLKYISNVVCARSILHVETWDGKTVAPEKGVHERLDADCFPIACWACSRCGQLAISTPIKLTYKGSRADFQQATGGDSP